MDHHHILTIAVATFALAAPTAVANPIGTDRDIRTSSLAGTVSAPAAQDLRNPDNRTPAAAGATERNTGPSQTTTQPTHGFRPLTNGPFPQDLRSPDTRDTAPTTNHAAETAAHRQDLRSPDARDAAAGPATIHVPDATIANPPRTTPIAASDGTEWTDIGIQSSGLLALALLAIGGTIAIMHRRRNARRIATTD